MDRMLQRALWSAGFSLQRLKMCTLKLLMLRAVLVCLLATLIIAEDVVCEVQPSGEVLAIAKTKGTETTPRVAYNVNRDEFLVVWTNEVCIPPTSEDCGSVVMGRQVLTDGHLLTSRNLSFPLSQGQAAEGAIEVAYNKRDDNYLVVWTEFLQTSSGLNSRLVSSDGKPLSRNRTFRFGEPFGLSYHSLSNQYLMASPYIGITNNGLGLGSGTNRTFFDTEMFPA